MIHPSELKGMVSKYHTYSTQNDARVVYDGLLETVYEYDETLCKILNAVILDNNKFLLSIEQQAMFDKYTEAADLGVENLSDKLKQLDTFLGNYRGEEEE